MDLTLVYSPCVVVFLICCLLQQIEFGDGSLDLKGAAKATYTLHHVRAIVEHVDFTLDMAYVDFVGAIIELDFGATVYGETFDGGRFSFPTATPISHSVREPAGLSGAVELRCNGMALPSFSNLPEHRLMSTPPWHMIGLPHKKKHESSLAESLLSLLETQHPEVRSLSQNETSGTRHRNTASSSKVFFGVILRYQDDSGFAMRNKQFHNFKNVSDPLQGCHVNILKSSNQRIFPTKMLFRAQDKAPVYGSTGTLVRENRAAETCKTRGAEPMVTAISVLNSKVVPRQHRKSIKTVLDKYPRVHETWHKIVPPLPSYCGLKNGSLLETQVLALRARHEASFLETQATSKVGDVPIPELVPIIRNFLMMFLPALFNGFMRSSTTRTAAKLDQVVPGDVLANVPEDVVELLGEPLVQNITSLLGDSLAASTTSMVSVGLGEQMGPGIAKALKESLADQVNHQVTPLLERAIPEKIGKTLPYLLERSLPIALSKLLTLSLTHSLVPVLTTALTRTPQQELWCHYCYHYNTHCHQCHESPQSEYYNVYYSAYYSDYYSRYYDEYYTNALKGIDAKQHPDGNNPVPARMDNNGRSAHSAPGSDSSDRVVTAGGSRLSDIENGKSQLETERGSNPLRDCDRHEMCKLVVKIAKEEEMLCDDEPDCEIPEKPNCANDQTLSNPFFCNAADCVEVLSIAKTPQDCENHFPPINY